MDIQVARTELLDLLPAIAEAALRARSKNSAHIRGLRTLLAEHQEGLCAGCGRSLVGKTVELCHIVANTHERTGYDIVAGNVYAGCKACNTYDMGRTGHEVVSSMARPDLVALVHPDRVACLRASDNGVEAVRNIRDAVAS